MAYSPEPDWPSSEERTLISLLNAPSDEGDNKSTASGPSGSLNSSRRRDEDLSSPSSHEPEPDCPSSEKRTLISLLNAPSDEGDNKSTASGPSGSLNSSRHQDEDPNSPSILIERGTLSIAMIMGMNFPHDRRGMEQKVLNLICRVYPCATATATAHNGFTSPSVNWQRDFNDYLQVLPMEAPPSDGVEAFNSFLFQGVYLGGQERHPVRLGRLMSEGQEAGDAFQIKRVEKGAIPDSIFTTRFLDHCRRVAAGLLGLNVTGNRLLSWDVIPDLFFPPAPKPKHKSKYKTKIGVNVSNRPRDNKNGHVAIFKRHAHSVSSEYLFGYTIMKFESTGVKEKKTFFQLMQRR